MTTKDPQIFPILDQELIGRLRAMGETKTVAEGEFVAKQGEPLNQFIIIEAGEMAVEIEGLEGTEAVATHGAGEFFGDVHLLSGRPCLVNARMMEAGVIITVPRSALQKLMSSDSQAGEILLRAFILRRIELLTKSKGDAVLIGSDNSAGTLRIREFLTRNGLPYTFLDLERDSDVQHTLDSFNLSVKDVPVLIACGRDVRRNPSNEEIAALLGLNNLNEEELRDVAIVGAGPAGLSAAVYAASEGLSTIVLETKAPGGQAGSSSRIENYLGFPLGISGQELAARAITQSQKFGAELLIAKSAVELSCAKRPYELKTTGGSTLRAKAIVIATGAQYRKLPLENLEKYEGVGVYYGATTVEAQACGEDEVIVVGGGNSAGQAAVFLSQTAKHVHILIRREHLSDTMSRYLVQRIEESPKITLHPFTEIESLEGEGHLSSVIWHNAKTGLSERKEIRHLYLMTGASPNTEWLQGCVALDTNGFVKTGADLSDHDLQDAAWPLARKPFLLERACQAFSQ